MESTVGEELIRPVHPDAIIIKDRFGVSGRPDFRGRELTVEDLV
jgi:hypothetical protein